MQRTLLNANYATKNKITKIKFESVWIDKMKPTECLILLI